MEVTTMPQIDWGNMALAFAALFGLLGWAAYFGLATSWNKPPEGEPEMVEPEARLVWPGSS